MKKRFFGFITYVVVFSFLYTNNIWSANFLQPNSAFSEDSRNERTKAEMGAYYGLLKYRNPFLNPHLLGLFVSSFNDRPAFLQTTTETGEVKTIPDTYSHLYRLKYPKILALIEYANIGEDDVVLDPFAGSGGIPFAAAFRNPSKLIASDYAYGPGHIDGIRYLPEQNWLTWLEIVKDYFKDLGQPIPTFRKPEFIYDDATQFLNLKPRRGLKFTKVVSSPPYGWRSKDITGIGEEECYRLTVNSLRAVYPLLSDNGEVYYIIPSTWIDNLYREDLPYKLEVKERKVEGEKLSVVRFIKKDVTEYLSGKVVTSNRESMSEVITVWDGKSDLTQLLKDADIVILGAPDSTGTKRNLGFGGAEKAPDKVIDELLRRDLSRLKGLKVVYLGNIKIPDTDKMTRVKRKDGQEVTFPDALLETYGNIKSVVSSVLKINPNIRLLQIGGDHGNVYPFNAPFSNGQGRLGFINVDAHFDTRDPRDPTRPEGPNSGTPFRFLLEEGHTPPRNAVFLGIDNDNPYAARLEEWVRSVGVENIVPYQEVMRRWKEDRANFAQFIDELLEKVVLGVDTGHISFCIDVVNEDEAPGCSARNKNGLTSEVVWFIAGRAGMNEKMHSLGVFEIIPELDNPDGRTVSLGVELLVEYFNGVVGRKGPVMKGVVKGEAVGIIRIIPDVVEGYRELFGLRENEIAVVPRYPTEDPTFARPMGIVSSDEFGRLSHAEVRARFWGIPHAVVSNLDSLAGFNGKWVYMKVEGDNVEFRLAAEDEIANWESYKPKMPKPRLAEVDLTTPKNILPWHETEKPSEVSYKFANLNLVREALSTYGDTHLWHGRVIPFATYKRVLNANKGVEERIREIVGGIDNNDIDDIKQKLLQVQDIIEGMDMPEEIWGDAENERPDIDEAWSIDYSISSETSFKDGLFIRTGTNAEDLPDYPGLGAGLYGTYSNIMRRDAKAYVKKAWASVWNLGAYLERQKLGIDHFGVYPAVQITKPVDASYAFVIHTADPDGSDTNLMVIEIVQGLGEGLVGDRFPGKPYRYLYDKKQDRIAGYEPATKKDKVVLNPEGGTRILPVDYTEDILMRDGPDSALVLKLARRAVRIEKEFNRPQDIEGAFWWDERDRKYIGNIFQSRAQVGYDRYPTVWEEFYRENIDWATDVSREVLQYADNVWHIDTHSFVNKRFFVRFTQEISETQDTRLIQDELSRWLRLFYSLGHGGRAVIRLMISNCTGYHRFFIEAIRRLEPDLIAKILDLIVVDTFGLSEDEFERFHKNNGQVISYLLVERIDKADILRQILEQVELMTLIGIINETWSWYKKPLNIIQLFSEKIAKLSNDDRIFVIRRLSQGVITWLGMEKEYTEVSVKEFLGALVTKAKNCRDMDEELVLAVDTDIGNFGQYAQKLMAELSRLKIDNARILAAGGAELKKKLQKYTGQGGFVICAVLKNSNCSLFEDMKDKIRITAVEDKGLDYIPIIPIIELAIKRAMGSSRDELVKEYGWLPDVKGIIEQEGILIIHLLPKPIPLQADEIRERYREEAVILSSA